jgi:hypothetical protein
MALILASGLLAGCASSDPCRAPTERELRQGVVRGVSISCKSPGAVSAPAKKESVQ